MGSRDGGGGAGGGGVIEILRYVGGHVYTMPFFLDKKSVLS